MKKVFEDRFLIALWILTTVALFFFVGHYSNIIIDVGREVYYPVQILKGKVLYQDLFNIYGPFSYLFNAGLIKLFGTKLSSFYGAGIVCSYLIVTAVYLISKQFFSSLLSFSIGILTVVTGICTPLIFNFTFPYSWAMVYGLLCFLYSLYFLLKSKEKENFIYLSSFLAGVSAANKYEFLLYGIFVIVYAFTKSLKTGGKSLAVFSVVPLFSFGILAAQGLTSNALFNTFKITSGMAKSHTLEYFYQNVGIFYHKKTFLFLAKSFLKTAIPFAGMIYGAYLHERQKWLIYVSAITFASLNYNNINSVFFFLPLLLLITTVFSYKKFKENPSLLIVAVSGICVSIKFFWGLLEGSYGTYVLGTVVLAFLALFFSYVPKHFEKTAAAFILIYSFLCLNNVLPLNLTRVEGFPLYTGKEISQSTSELLEYIKTNTKPSDKIVVLPEGMVINFLTQRDSDDWYNSLIPLYLEVFGEKSFVEHYKKSMPEYFIFNNQTTADYGFDYICKDYAVNFCRFVSENYTLNRVISNGFNYLVYKRK